ncbi:MAG: ABC transporter ATP-binding protein [Sumerlaeia bacterium]
MSIAIKVQNLSKRYSIQASKGVDLKGTLRESLSRSAVNAFRRVRNIASMDFSTNPNMQEFYALRGVEFQVQQGEVLGIIGRNGAGKSTLLKILSRITEPTTGRVELYGRVASLLEVGTGFHPELTGRENIFLNGAVLGMPRREIQRKFDEIIAFADVEQFLDVPVKRYSSGMFVRLAFSVAAHLEPEILVVDEVLAVGDIAFQRKCIGKMNEVATQSGRTILFVSHQMTAVQRLCNSAIVLEKGEIIFTGSVQQGISKYVETTSENLGSGENLQQRPRPRWFKRTFPLYLNRCVLINHAGQASENVNFAAPIRLLFEFHSEKSLSDFTLKIFLDSQTHTRVLTVQSDQASVSFSFPEPGTQRILVDLGILHLIPGIYTLSVAASRLGSVLDRVEQASSFQVLPVSEVDSLLPQDQSGIIAPPVTWNQLQDQQEIESLIVGKSGAES